MNEQEIMSNIDVSNGFQFLFFSQARYAYGAQLTKKALKIFEIVWWNFYVL